VIILLENKEILINFINNEDRKSIPLDYFEKNCKEIKLKYNPRIFIFSGVFNPKLQHTPEIKIPNLIYALRPSLYQHHGFVCHHSPTTIPPLYI
jgi:hypothetical protein